MTGIPVAPDWGAALGKAFEGLGSGLEHIADPQVDFHTAFRQAVAENPAIIQNLTDYAHMNNGDLGPGAKLIPKDLQTQILKGTPTAAARVHKAVTDQLATRLPQHPEEVAAAASKAVTGENPGAFAEDQTVAGLQPATVDFLNSVKADDQKHGTNNYQRIAAQKYGLLEDQHFQESIAARRDYISMHQQDRVDHFQESEANSWFNKTGGAGSPDIWRDYLYNPTTQQRASKLLSGEMSPTNDRDRELIQIATAHNSADTEYQRTHLKASTLFAQSVYKQIVGDPDKKILPADENTRPGLIHTLNQEFAYEGKPVQAVYGYEPGVDSTSGIQRVLNRRGLHFVSTGGDNKGQIVNPDAVLNDNNTTVSPSGPPARNVPGKFGMDRVSQERDFMQQALQSGADTATVIATARERMTPEAATAALTSLGLIGAGKKNK